MLKQVLILGFIGVIGCSPAVAETVTAKITDHYKTVIKQSPYNVEVCRDVSVSGDKSGDMLKGAIIGGIIGNNVGNIDNGGALGAVLGGMLGHSNSNATGGTKRVCRLKQDTMKHRKKFTVIAL